MSFDLLSSKSHDLECAARTFPFVEKEQLLWGPGCVKPEFSVICVPVLGTKSVANASTAARLALSSWPQPASWCRVFFVVVPVDGQWEARLGLKEQ